MKNVLIISPDWIPANLVGIQRPRLICNFLHEFGWHPVILTVDPKYYFLPVSEELRALVSPDVEVHVVRAFGKKRLPGCTASVLRGFLQLYRRGVQLCREQKIDCIWQPMPPGSALMLARLIHNKTGIPYGADYTDPWVQQHGVNLFSKKGFVNLMARLCEPYAAGQCAFLAGVSRESYEPVMERNPQLKSVPNDYFPLGFDENDYHCRPLNPKLLWDEEPGVRPYLYAGAFLPQSHVYVDRMFALLRKMRDNGKLPPQVRFYFVGTGNGDHPCIMDYAQKHGIEEIIREKRDRISYLEVLHNLQESHGVLAIGSTEPHYTASKIFQALLSKRPVLALFHENSTVNEILHKCSADAYLVRYSGTQDWSDWDWILEQTLVRYLEPAPQWNVKLDGLSAYSAKESAKKLVSLMEQTIEVKK